MMLRQDTGNPDAQFFGLLKEFVDAYAGKTASTWDFKHLVEKRLTPAMDLKDDKKLDWFFDEWVFATGIPAYSLDYKIEANGNGFAVAGGIKPTAVSDQFIMSVPVYADDRLLGRVPVSDTEGQFRFSVPTKPERVVIDPEETVLRSTVP